MNSRMKLTWVVMLLVLLFSVVRTSVAGELFETELGLLNGALERFDDGDHHHAAVRPDTHAPAGLMGDHAHSAGEVMAEYKFMTMSMDDNRVGTDEVSDVAALTASGVSFMVAPTRMVMDRHMLHVMYAPSDRVTLYMMPMWTDYMMFASWSKAW